MADAKPCPGERVHGPVIDPDRLRDVMGHFATGVTVVTGRAPGGGYAGLTANSLTSVSLDPPLVLVCIDRNSISRETLLRTERFAVSVLRRDQEEVAHRFSGEARETRFDDLRLRFGRDGVPILDDALAWVECRVWRWVEAGDHTVLFGEVEDGGAAGADPLVFFRGGYGTVAP
jgi:3-hydroxy-9,10-secoandrosta-1,3,5(10)-triene-9,17-dione monooxygenase reductase component